ncbi:unnamed protein product [Durusdinium trenchii]|uniref:Uncharacterized protein n=2 Tax=Durusdinium trenchii TaxID=1381693 RepID=A0ABP0SVZ9_9DINO
MMTGNGTAEPMMTTISAAWTCVPMLKVTKDESRPLAIPATFAFASAAGCRRTDFAVTPRDPSAASTHVKADERSGQVRLRVPRIQGD